MAKKKDKSDIIVVGPNKEDETAKQVGLESWSIDRMTMMSWRPFIGTLAMSLELIPVVDHRCATACTDGKRIFFNPHFILGMDEDKRLTILAHEIWHCAMSHFTRQNGRIEDHTSWNHAIDHEVNSLLEDDGFIIPNGAVLYRQHKGKSAEQVYELIKNLEIEIKGQVMDEHILDDAATPDTSGKNGYGTIENCGDDNGQITIKVDGDFRPRRTDDIWKEWRAKVMSAAQQCQGRGVDMENYSQQLDEMFESRVPWRELLRQFLTPMFGCTRKWLPPNRRYVYKRVYLPSIQKQKQLRIAVVIDTSGSTSGDIVRTFMSELVGLLSSFGAYELRLIQCDMHIHEDSTYDLYNPFDPSKFRLKGGGGTDLRPPFDLVEENGEPPEVLIFMTDGYGPAPKRAPAFPVLWAVIEGGVKPVKWGQEIEMPLGTGKGGLHA
ncbi:MAG: VWA-like domain-containing protein [Candidatus Poseidoniaceae archaeon]|jgi:predicted metal-dependent peptidase|nr:VWA-like domain-containing protein [Candidatus Poseidoniaceae archaeon]